MDDLDKDLRDLRARISRLEAARTNLTTVLLSSPHLTTRLQQRPVTRPTMANKALKIVKKQANRNQQNLYRTCAGVTAYKVKDPDPNAVDNGNVLGVQIEVSVKGTFLPPYHVFFVRPDSREEMRNVLRIHRHTVPTAIPLGHLAERYLPQPEKGSAVAPVQNMEGLIRWLRRELVSWALRKAAFERLRDEAGLGLLDAGNRDGLAIGKVFNAVPDSEDEEDDDHEDMEELGSRIRRRNGPSRIVDISANAAFREIVVEWSNGQVGRMVVNKDGQVEKGVVRTADGIRVSEMERKAVGRVEELVSRLTGKTAVRA